MVAIGTLVVGAGLLLTKPKVRDSLMERDLANRLRFIDWAARRRSKWLFWLVTGETSQAAADRSNRWWYRISYRYVMPAWLVLWGTLLVLGAIWRIAVGANDPRY